MSVVLYIKKKIKSTDYAIFINFYQTDYLVNLTEKKWKSGFRGVIKINEAKKERKIKGKGGNIG